MSSLDTSFVPDYQGKGRLDSKIFVVLGAGQGIGRQTAHALAQAGATVICVGRTAEMTEAVAREISGFPIIADAMRRDEVEWIFAETTRQFGRVDGAIDVIGKLYYKGLMTISEADWDLQFNTTLKHALFTMQIGGDAIMRSGGGAIVIVGSMGASHASVSPGYGASKAALHQLVRIAGAELGPKGVRVNGVAPSLTRTPRVEQTISAANLARMENAYPLRRIANPADVASTILFLATDQSSFINSQIINVDGGMYTLSPIPSPSS
jgi:NAD(P)-dependent dehydrogenase (short-subunit alcohol dehydrogenase family)